MDREQIRQLIQRENLSEDNFPLARQLVRLFDELRELDAQLEGSSTSPADLRRLEAENRKLEQTIRERETEKGQSGKGKEAAKVAHRDALASSAQKKRSLEADIEKQREESRQLRAALDQLTNKTAEVERLKRRRNEVLEEANKLQARIESLGEEYYKNAELLETLKSFVEKLEGVETQMKETMGAIWGGFKNDAFDKMF